MRAVAGLLCLLALGACREERLAGNGCREDAECGSPTSAWRCEAQTGECYCRTDAACPGGQFCNTAGFCQDRAGCEKNADCLDPSLVCDTSSGQCLARGRCSSDLQCPLGQVCDVGRAQCIDGCRDSGDCPGTSCRCGDVACACDGGTPEAMATCALGVCDAQFCASQDFCRFGELCGVVPDGQAPFPTCHSDFDIDARPYCARCTYGAGLETCGTGPNFCIIDTRTASTYCGADCSEGQQCPRGYGCRDIRVVYTRWQCSPTMPCPGDPTLPCATDEECRRGGTCLKPAGSPTGFCSGQCRMNEGAAFGYCSCQVDADCPLESCSQGECSISRRKCVTDDECRTIRCVDFDGVGGCLIGQNCTPTAGLTCVEVQ